MFGLMKVSTHEAEVERLKTSNAQQAATILYLQSQNRDLAASKLRLAVRVSALERDLQRDALLPKIDASIKKGARRTGSRSKLTEKVKVPVKGKVKS